MSTTALAAFAGALLLLAAPAKADIILSLESVTGPPGSSGTFDVLLTNTGSSAQNIAAFNFELSTTDANITFTDATTATTTDPYIFSSGDSLFGPDILTSTTGQVILAGDLSASGNGTDVGAGQTYGIGSVAYSIAPGAMNGDLATITFDPFPNTNLSDASLNNVNFTAQSGTIAVQAASTVPEPSETIFLLAACLAVAATRRRRPVA